MVIRKLLPRSRRQYVVYIAVITVLALGGVLLVYRAQRQVTPEQEPLITHSTDTPDESATNASNYNWRGTQDEPRKIRIQKISVDAYVQKAGVDQNNKVAVPNNVHLAGWFADSVKPGQTGLSIIAGHVSGRTTDGVFEQLRSVSQGDEFEIELGNGEVKRYRVVSTTQVKEAESASVVFSQDPKVTSQVNLVTCGGAFNKATNSYDDRVVVAGELIQ